jgi:hypothetical protein
MDIFWMAHTSEYGYSNSDDSQVLYDVLSLYCGYEGMNPATFGKTVKESERATTRASKPDSVHGYSERFPELAHVERAAWISLLD